MACYLVAKHADRVGSVALRTFHGKHLTALKRRIEMEVGYQKIQLVTISRPSAYGEYEPYLFADSESEFEKIVIAMK